MGCLKYFLLFALLMAIFEFLAASLPIIAISLVFIIIVYFAWRYNSIENRLKRFEKKYYISEAFLNTKKKIDKYIENCNDLNDHISILKNKRLGSNSILENPNIMIQAIIIMEGGNIKTLLMERVFIIVQEVFATMLECNLLNIFANILILNQQKK